MVRPMATMAPGARLVMTAIRLPGLPNGVGAAIQNASVIPTRTTTVPYRPPNERACRCSGRDFLRIAASSGAVVVMLVLCVAGWWHRDRGGPGYHRDGLLRRLPP